MRIARILLLFPVSLMLLPGILQAYERLQGPTELLFWNKSKACDGYTLFGVGGTSYLIDMEGRVVQTWRLGTNPRLLDNGNLLDATRDDPSGFQGFREVDWDGNAVWEYVENREGYAPHHDWVRIFNKKLGAYTTLYIANKSISHQEAIAAGADPRRGPYDDAQMDAIVEVDGQGNVVWQWCFFDHVVQDVDPARANYVGQGRSIADYPGRININLPGRPLKRDWLHCNALDYNAELGQLVTSSVQGEFYVIDHDSTFIAGDPQGSIKLAAGTAGDFLYRFGDPARYGQGKPPAVLEDWTQATSGHKQIGGCHDVHWIKPGLPGAGHFLIFDNGQYLFDRTSQSSVVEINGFLDAGGRDTGSYVNPPDAGYEELPFHRDTHKPPRLVSRQVVWSYRSQSNQGFFSHIGSGAQRLPNGNTLICAGTEGHLFEVTAEGELAWEYINPITRQLGTVEVMPDCLPMTNALFRAYRYTADHPALQGKDLSPKGTITAAFPRKPDLRAAGGGPGGARPGQREPKREGQGGQRGRRDGDDRAGPQDRTSVVAPGAALAKVGDGFQFTEGPTAGAQGDVYFTDVRASRIHRWSPDGKIALVRENTGSANGLAFDNDGNLLACQGDPGRIVSFDPQGKMTVVADQFDGKPLNQTNDLWVDPKGGVYFSDPVYGRGRKTQDGEHVYYVAPDRSRVVRVIDDMVRPNGLVGTPDGRTLYVTDHGGGRTCSYDVAPDGSLANKRPFAEVGGDGMTLDEEGNVYIAAAGILVYDPGGRQRETIEVPEQPTNVCFGGRDGRTLFITARSTVYTMPMRVSGASTSGRGARGGPEPARGQEPRRSPDDGRPRLPWPVVHARELDVDGDGAVTREEMETEVKQTFSGCDRNGDGRLTGDEYGGPGGARTAMGGFVKQHASEIDADGDGVLTPAELLDIGLRMFDKADANGDGKLSGEDVERP